MRASVIIPTYKRPEYLEKCLKSLLAQSVLPEEIIVVRHSDDADTAAVIAVIRQNHPRGDLIKEMLVAKLDIVCSENQGLNVAKGDIVCFIDDDAVACENWIELIILHYQADLHVGGVGGPVIPYVDTGPLIEYTDEFAKITWWGRRITNATKIPCRCSEVDMLRGANMSFRRSLVDGCDEHLLPYWRRFEDDICFSVKSKGYKIIADPELKVFHYEAPMQSKKNRDDTPLRIIGLHHNSVYVKLKHFKGIRKICSLAYDFLWGDDTAPGALAFCIQAVKHLNINMLRLLTYAMIGKLKGILTYMHWKYGRCQ
jgi:GT2 family glycosyltransferase